MGLSAISETEIGPLVFLASGLEKELSSEAGSALCIAAKACGRSSHLLTKL
jgi:hypothetical protein